MSKYRTERVTAIADALAASDYDVITLQELWVFADFEFVRAAVSKKLQYSKFFYRSVLRAPVIRRVNNGLTSTWFVAEHLERG